MDKIYRAVKYIRTSHPDDQSQCGDSVANQRKLIDTFIKSHPEIIAVSEKIDEGYSGLFTERPAFKELLADVETGAINCIVVKDLSRWSRDYIETGRYLRDYFPTHSVRFISVDDNIDSARPDGLDKTIALLKSIFSEHYSRDVSIKTRSSLDAKRRQGKYVGAIPIYGYQKSVENRHQLIPDPNTADNVKSIFRMKLDGLSAATIATELNNSNIPSPLSYKRECGLPIPTGGFADKNNARWSATTVLRILRDENYTGTLIQGRQRYLDCKSDIVINLDESEWVKTENAHLAIISHADYEAVQRTMTLDTRTAPMRKRVHIFSGMLICGCCGENMTRKTVPYKEKRYCYYYCPTGKRKGCLSSGTISVEVLRHTVTYRVRERIGDIERLKACISNAHIEELIQEERNQKINMYDMKIRELQRYRLLLRDIKAECFISDVEHQGLENYYSAEIACLDTELSILWKESRCNNALIEDYLGWERSFLQFSNMNELDRFAVVKMIRSICVLVTNEIVIDFAHQSEYEQLIRYTALGGHAHGEKEPQTE